MLDPHNVASLSRNGRVFCLVATPDEIFDRVVNDTLADRASAPVGPGSSPADRRAARRTRPDYRRFAQLTTDAVSADAVASDLVALATSDPHRFAIDNPSGDYEYSVGAAILPVRPSAGADRGSDGGRHQRRGRQPVPGELWRRRPDDHAAGRARSPEEPGGRATRLRRPARRQRRSIGDDRVARRLDRRRRGRIRGGDVLPWSRPRALSDRPDRHDRHQHRRQGRARRATGQEPDRPVQAAVGRGCRRGDAADAESPSVRVGDGGGGQARLDRRFAPARPARRRRVARAESRGA